LSPPAARVELVRDNHFGTTLEDPYRWMEQEGEESHRWLEGRAGYARSVLDVLLDVQQETAILAASRRAPVAAIRVGPGCRSRMARRSPSSPVLLKEPQANSAPIRLDG
jgi:Prolyl oligopeptidase, N-terminal beta-propeller domain